MLYKQFYANKNESLIEKEIRDEGYEPSKIVDGPGREYQRHTHPETKLLAVLYGGMCVTVDDKHINIEKGDKLVIPGNVPHSAKVWDDGCKFFWSEKLN